MDWCSLLFRTLSSCKLSSKVHFLLQVINYIFIIIVIITIIIIIIIIIISFFEEKVLLLPTQLFVTFYVLFKKQTGVYYQV